VSAADDGASLGELGDERTPKDPVGDLVAARVHAEHSSIRRPAGGPGQRETERLTVTDVARCSESVKKEP